jgi:hypothetical protein
MAIAIIIGLLLVIIALLPGGANALRGLFTSIGIVLFLGLMVGYAIIKWETALWLTGATIVVGGAIWLVLRSGGEPVGPLHTHTSNDGGWSTAADPAPTPASRPTIRVVNPAPPPPPRNENDPFVKVVKGRPVKRAVLDLQELIDQRGMVDAFKTVSEEQEPSIWRHPAGIYLACRRDGAARVCSTIASARDYIRKDRPAR